MIQNNKDYYYLHNNVDWTMYVNDRIKDKVTNLNYKYKFNKKLDISTDFKSTLLKLGITINLVKDNYLYDSFEMKLKFPH